MAPWLACPGAFSYLLQLLLKTFLNFALITLMFFVFFLFFSLYIFLHFFSINKRSPPAHFAEGRGETVCTRCPFDTFREKEGATSSSDCSACAARVGNNMVTLDQQFGSDTPNDCVCKAGYLDVGAYDDAGNLRGVDSRCIICPEGANCASPGANLGVSLIGFFFFLIHNFI